MQKYSNNIINQYGAPIAGASVKILSIDGSLALIYSDNNSSPLTNPTTSDEYGQFSFYAKNGRYSIAIEKQGVISQTISDILLEDLHDSNGNILVTTPALMGYGAGAGDTEIQLTSKFTAVTIHKPCGKIITASSSIAAGETVSFIVNNNLMTDSSLVIVNTLAYGNYMVWAEAADLSFRVYVKNVTGVAFADSVLINFAIIKGSAL